MQAKITVGKSVGERLRESQRTRAPQAGGSRLYLPGRISIVVPGRPLGKPRMTQRDKWKQRPSVVAYRAWCDLIRDIAGDVPPASETKAVLLTAVFEPPASWSKKKRLSMLGEAHRHKPDADNVAKGVIDALWKDDSGIASLSIIKSWGEQDKLVIEILL